MKTLRRHLFLFLSMLAVCCLVANTANATTYTPLSCGADGKTVSGELFPSEITSGNCTTNAHIFSNIICNFVAIMNSVLGTVYCGIQSFMLPILGTTLTLYVAIFGVQILMGMAQVTIGEAAIRLLKIGAVWGFATQATWGIGKLYTFFVGLSLSGINWTMGTLWSGGSTVNTDTNINSLFGTIDENIYNAITLHLMNDKAELVTFFLLLSVVCFPIFLMALAWAWLTISVFLRTLLSFMMSISAIGFLIALSPFFLSFMLFKATSHLFDTWVKYLISYSLQVIIVFACIAMWMMITLQFTDFFSDLAKVVMPYPKATYTGAVATVDDTRGICPLEYSTDTKGPHVQCRTSGWTSADLVPPSKFVQDAQFMYFLAYHLITLMIVAYAFSALLKNSHEIARELAGPTDVAPLGGGAFGGGLGSIRDSLSFGKGKEGYSPSASREARNAAQSGGGGGIISQLSNMVGLRR